MAGEGRPSGASRINGAPTAEMAGAGGHDIRSDELDGLLRLHALDFGQAEP
jgi:hypothetical protein